MEGCRPGIITDPDPRDLKTDHTDPSPDPEHWPKP